MQELLASVPSVLANVRKLNALESVQPRKITRHVPSSYVAMGLNLGLVESVQPATVHESSST